MEKENKKKRLGDIMDRYHSQQQESDSRGIMIMHNNLAKNEPSEMQRIKF